MKRGTKLIVVDPRANWLATRAEHHLQLRPGTDGALALALLYAVIKTDKYDKQFVEKWCYGFDKLAERVAQYPPEWAEEITGVPAEDIYAAAECLVQKPSSACTGVAIDQNPTVFRLPMRFTVFLLSRAIWTSLVDCLWDSRSFCRRCCRF